MAITQPFHRVLTFPRFWDVRDWRISQKLLGGFLLAAILPLSISGYVAVTSSREALLAQGSRSLAAISADTSTAIDDYLRARREDIVMASQLPEMIAYASNPSDVTARANAVKALAAAAGKKDYDSVAIVNKQGNTILASSSGDIGEDVSFREYYQPALRGQAYIADPAIDLITNKPSIYFSAPIRDAAGGISGVIRSRVNLSGIWDLVEGDLGSAGTGSFGLLLDEHGIRIAHSVSKGNRVDVENTLLYRAIAPLPDATLQEFTTVKRFAAKGVQVLPLPEVAAATGGPRQATFESNADNSTVRHQATITGLVAKPWYYVVMAPIPTFTGPTDTLALRLVVITVVVALLASLGAWLMARGLSKPIIYLTQAADRISMGEMDVKIEIDRKDEIGELAEAFGRMQTGMQAAIERYRAQRTP